MTHKALIRRLQISCLGLDPIDPLRLLVDDVVEALREHAMREIQRLGQEIEQEPVAWWNDTGTHIDLNVSGRGTPLYAVSPQRTWVGLTPQERDEINEQVYGAVPHHVAFHAAIEAKLKELNS